LADAYLDELARANRSGDLRGIEPDREDVRRKPFRYRYAAGAMRRRMKGLTANG
jgi:hypothetical protein